MKKSDFKKSYKNLYSAPKDKAKIIEVPPLKYLMVDGKGRPEEKEFQDAASTIFPVAYILKFMIKAEDPKKDFVVMPMEVKWSLNRSLKGSEKYSWTMMVMQPEYATEELFKMAVEKAITKTSMPFLSTLHFEVLNEGLCAQILHVGPYGKPMDDTFEIMKIAVRKHGYLHDLDSHDIYFNDVRKTKPEKLRTLIRIKIYK